MSTTTNRVPAQWTDDCQGKKDYDGELVSISTRYWPRGGSFLVMQGGQFVSDGNDPQRQRSIPPSAKSSILVRVGGDEGDFGDDIVLASREFEAETEAEVKQAVEAWAAEQYARIISALQREFSAHS